MSKRTPVEAGKIDTALAIVILTLLAFLLATSTVRVLAWLMEGL